MERKSQLLVALLIAAATASASAATPAGRLGRDLLQSGVTCKNEIPYCTARRCTTRILGSRETYVCLRCMPGFIPARGIDGRSIVQCVCPPGTVLNSAGDQCSKCPAGSFCPGGNTKAKRPTEDLGGRSESCGDEGLTTKFEGASKYTDCVAEGGYVLPDAKGDQAKKCSAGFYAPQNNRLKTCLRCQSGLTTPQNFTDAHVSRIDVCQVPPGKFWELNVVRDCPKGLYRSNFVKVNTKAAISCLSCPDYWTTNRTAAESINECNTLVPGYQISNDTDTDLAITAQEDADWDPSDFVVEPCPIGTYYDAAATDFKCKTCPHGATTRQAGALSVDECMVPPGYFIASPESGDKTMEKCPTSGDTAAPGFYRSGWVSYSQAISRGATGTDVCTACGDGLLSKAMEADEKPRADGTPDPGSKVAATSASCYIPAGWGVTFDPTDFKKFKAMECLENTYGVANETFGFINAPCKACGKNLKSARRSTSFQNCTNQDGFGYTSEGANQCPPNFWATADSMAPCEPCPEGRITRYEPGVGELQASIDNCVVPEGHGVYDGSLPDPWEPETPDSGLPVRICPIGFFSAGDGTVNSTTSNPKCVACTENKSTREIGAAVCDTCAAGYRKSGTSCVECAYGTYSSTPSETCSDCPSTDFADLMVGAVFNSYGLTFKMGLMGKEMCVPRHAQQAAPTGDRLRLPDSMFSPPAGINTTNLNNEEAIQGAVDRCVRGCDVNKCCIAQMQLDSTTLNCKRAELNPLKPFEKDDDSSPTKNNARLYYKLPPSEMAAASINDTTVAAKTISSGIYAVCDIEQFKAAADKGQVGTSFDPARVEDEDVVVWNTRECNNDETCQKTCNAQSTCWGYIWVKDRGFALRGGEDHLGGRTFFSSPDPVEATDRTIASIVESW